MTLPLSGFTLTDVNDELSLTGQSLQYCITESGEDFNSLLAFSGYTHVVSNFPAYVDTGGIAADVNYSVVVPFPTSVSNNDIAIVALLDADNDTFTVPTNWTLIQEDGTVNNCSIAWMWYRCDGTEGGTTQQFDSQLLAGSVVAGIIYTFSGCITGSTPIEDSDISPAAIGTTYTCPAVTTADDDRLVVCMVNVEDNVTINTLTDWTENYYENTTIGSDAAFKLQSREESSATTINSASASIGGNDYKGVVVFALKPAV